MYENEPTNKPPFRQQISDPPDRDGRPPPRRINLADVLRLAAEGCWGKEISRRLGFAHSSVSRFISVHKIAITRGGGGRTAGTSSLWIERDPKLRRLVDEGATAAEAAAELGITRNSVIGRAYRLKLTWARTPVAEYQPAPRTADAFPAPGHCWWSNCSEAVKPHSSYCPEHHARVFQPAMPKRTQTSAEYRSRSARRWGSAAK